MSNIPLTTPDPNVLDRESAAGLRIQHGHASDGAAEHLHAHPVQPRTHGYGHLAYRPDIDGMRAVAVLAVLGFHGFPQWVHGGFVGVDIFFVISGFLISGIIFSSMAKSGGFNYIEFYSRRIRRIFPALFLVLAATYAIGWFTLLSDEFRSLGKHTFAGAFFVSNILNWTEAGYFDASSETKPLLHLWSLGVEEQFYIVWPIILIAFAKFRRASLLLPIWGIIAASFLYASWFSRKDFDASFYLPFARFWELMLGCLLAYRASRAGPPARDRPRLANVLAVLGLGLIAGSIIWLTRADAVAMPGTWAAFPTFGACALILAGPDTWVNRSLLSNRLFVWFGLISYPLYLWHWSLLVYSDFLSGGHAGPGLRMAVLALSVLLAWLTYRFVENPMRKHRNIRAKVAVLCTLVFAVGIAGLAAYLNNGFEERRGAISRSISDDLILPLATRKSDGSCERLLHLGVDPGVVCISNSSTPRVLVVGDSHAMSFASAALVEKQGLDLALVAVHGCLTYARYANESCNQVGEEAVRALARLPSVDTVAIAYAFGYSDTDPNYADAIGKLVDRLRPAGKRVVIVLDAPKLEEDVHNCIHRSLEIGSHDGSPCMPTRRDAEQRQAAYRNAMARFKGGRDASVSVFDSFESLCDARRCPGMDDSRIFYFDSNHLSISGSAKVLDDFARRYYPLPGTPADGDDPQPR
jgi:peptidoglycan/LPS O-acetylase OafA/YrhL